MGKRPKVTELERKRQDGPHVLWLQGSCSPHCATLFSWSSIHSDEGAQMQGMQQRRSSESVFPRLNGRDKSLPPTVSLSQSQRQLSSFLFCPLSSPEAQPEAHCHGFLSSGNDLHFHSSRKFCLWTFLNMIFTGCL